MVTINYMLIYSISHAPQTSRTLVALVDVILKKSRHANHSPSVYGLDGLETEHSFGTSIGTLCR